MPRGSSFFSSRKFRDGGSRDIIVARIAGKSLRFRCLTCGITDFPLFCSIDTLFLLPAWAGRLWERSLVVGSKLYLYLDQEKDIDDYRGYADLFFRYGNEDGWLMSALWRHGAKNRDTVQLDVSYPIRKKIMARTGGYIYLQAFQGYGESLLTYDQKEDMNVRIGFAIVR